MATNRPSTMRKKRRLPFALAGSAGIVVFAYLSFFGPIFPLFLDSMGLKKAEIGLMVSLLPFSALIAPIVAPAIARIGLKRSFLTFWGARLVPVGLLVAAPYIRETWGAQTAFQYLIAVIAVFAYYRACALTAWSPWNQEFIPASIRGKYSALDHVISVLIGIVTVTLASYAIGAGGEPNSFVGLFAVAVVAGIFSTLMYAFVPGGAPIRDSSQHRSIFRSMGVALRDRQFMLFLAGVTFALLGSSSTIPFVPLFMKKSVGLTTGQVVGLESISLMAGLSSCFLWGWAVDRYGSKPVMTLTLILIVAYPLGLLGMPRNNPMGTYFAIGLVFYFGLINPGWFIAFTRHLYVSVVPEYEKIGYLTVYYAWTGLIGGVGPLLAGKVLDACEGLAGKAMIVPIDQYTPLFAVYVAMVLAAAVLFSRVRAEGAMPATRFAGMFFHGNPFAAFHSMIIHNLATKEGARISAIERLGHARSPLNVDELVAALEDPSFNVRMEAIVSIARTRPNERLTKALVSIAAGPEPDLAIAAVWALGRIGDKAAIKPLRKLLLADYPLLAARSARSLAQMSDHEVASLVLARFRDELDDGLRIAYASALGMLACTEALQEILAFLNDTSSESTRRELTLAAARMVHTDRYLVRLWRRLAPDAGTATSEALLGLRRKLVRFGGADKTQAQRIDQCIEMMAENDLAGGIALLTEVIRMLPMDQLDQSTSLILRHCARAFEKFGAQRIEFLLLCLHTLNALPQPSA